MQISDDLGKLGDEPVSLPALDVTADKISFHHNDPAYHSINVPNFNLKVSLQTIIFNSARGAIVVGQFRGYCPDCVETFTLASSFDEIRFPSNCWRMAKRILNFFLYACKYGLSCEIFAIKELERIKNEVVTKFSSKFFRGIALASIDLSRSCLNAISPY